MAGSRVASRLQPHEREVGCISQGNIEKFSPMSVSYRCWAEVDLTALQGNLAWIRHRVGPHVKIMTVVKASSIYETQPWGKADQPEFLNQALEVATDLPPKGVLNAMLEIEKQRIRIGNG